MVQFRKLLQLLVDAEIEFVVVGGVAATLHGSAEPTRDLDVCISLTRDSWSRVARVIAPLNPRFALTPDKRPIASDADLTQFRNLYVLTDLGRIDFLGEVPPIGHLETVRKHAEEFQIEDAKIRVISLEDLIQVKEYVRRPKDLEVAAELRAIRDRLRSK
jgi:predicted nucleotidyltransferase